MRFVADDWLGERLGKSAYRVDTNNGRSDDLPSGPSFLYAKVPTPDVSTVRGLERLGLQIVDVNIVLEADPRALSNDGGRGSDHTLTQDASVRPSVSLAGPDDRNETLDIAATAFTRTRFHLDSDIPADRANQIKRDWVDSYFRDRRGDRLWIARDDDGQPMGFLADLVANENGSVRVIDLIGVNAQSRSKGYGAALVHKFMDAGRDATRYRVGTQAANVGSIRFYERLGFRVSNSYFVLHAHLSA